MEIKKELLNNSDIHYCVTCELKENYSFWIMIFEGNFISGTCFPDTIFQSNYDFEVHDVVLKTELTSELENKINEVIKLPSFLSSKDKDFTIYSDEDGLHSHGIEISKEDVYKISEIIKAYKNVDNMINIFKAISDAKDIDEYMRRFHHALALADISGKTKYYDIILEQSKLYEDKQLKKAIKTGKPQLIYFEASLPTENGMQIKQELCCQMELQQNLFRDQNGEIGRKHSNKIVKI